jgi:hypothetical protein
LSSLNNVQVSSCKAGAVYLNILGFEGHHISQTQKSADGE